jgi:hypothetical protein
VPDAAIEKTLRPAPTIQPKRFRWWLVLPGVIALVFVFYAIVLTINWPFTESALVEALQERSLRKVTVARFRRTYFPPGCVADGIRFLRIKHPDQPPLLTIQKLVIEDNYLALLMFRRSLATVRVIGLHLMVPAKEPAGEPSPVMPLTYTDSKNPLKIGVISADGAVLDFLSQTTAKRPLRLLVNKLSLYDVGGQTPVSYRTEIHIPEPSGDITSGGTWGPWDPSHPATTQVRGEYVYQNANLSSLPGLSGILESRGGFNGTLDQINVNGKANVSNFRIEGASHSCRLNTDIQAVVDATKGDVSLSRIMASFNRTALLFSGSVAGKEGSAGKTVDLRVTSGRARLEDLLGLFIASKHAAMTGNVSLHGHMTLPPGEAPFVQRIMLKGAFGVDAGLFSDKKTEQELAKLSVSAIKGDKEEDREDPQTVLSDIKGEVDATQGVARLTRLSFDVPGAHATLDGTFNLDTYKSDMHGVLTTNGEISDVASGAKSFFLKALTPFFKRKKHVKVVPFKLTGPYGNTTISLDLMSKKK